MAQILTAFALSKLSSEETKENLELLGQGFIDKNAWAVVQEIFAACHIEPSILDECCCASPYIRKANIKHHPENNARDYIEQLILATLQAIGWDKEKPIHLTDLGAGNLGQTAVIACSLASAGYHVLFNLVDRVYESDVQEHLIPFFNKILDEINHRFAAMGGKAEIKTVCKDYEPEQFKSDILLVIDGIDTLTIPLQYDTRFAFYEAIVSEAQLQNPEILVFATSKNNPFGVVDVYQDLRIKKSYKIISRGEYYRLARD